MKKKAQPKGLSAYALAQHAKRQKARTEPLPTVSNSKGGINPPPKRFRRPAPPPPFMPAVGMRVTGKGFARGAVIVAVTPRQPKRKGKP